MAYRLLATDFDLTLSRADRTVSDRSQRVIRMAEEAGIRISLASGRMPIACRRPLQYFSPDTPAILGNGSVLYLPRTGEILWSNTLEETTALTLMDWLLRREDGSTIVWCGDRLYANRQDALTEQYCRICSVPAYPIPSPEALARDGIYKLLLFASPENTARAWRDFKEQKPAEVSYFPSGANMLELVAPGVDKGTGLLRCAEYLGIAPSETAAVGDAGNDLAMLRTAALSAAVENASEEVKAAADRIVPSCEEDGVAWLIENILMKS